MVNKILDREICEIKDGFVYMTDKAGYECLICGKVFEDGEIFKNGDRFFEAARAVKEHVNHEHGGVLEHLLKKDKKYTGLTPKQVLLLKDIADGLTDKEIAHKNGVAASTIRHQRFAFREKAKQAKIFLAVFELAEEGVTLNDKDRIVEVHPGATMVDDRYFLTVEENEKVIKTYFDSVEPLRLKALPAKEKKKIAVLRRIAGELDVHKIYEESELNHLLKGIYEDIATIRRYLIEYGFVERTKDCTEYWVKK